MDEADVAHEQEEYARRAALSRRKPVPEHDGYCLNCGEESAGAYCDAGCREDAERFDRARERDARRPDSK
jgi:hypothetical protein